MLVQAIEADVASLTTAFLQRARGPTIHNELARFIRDLLPSLLKTVSDGLTAELVKCRRDVQDQRQAADSALQRFKV